MARQLSLLLLLVALAKQEARACECDYGGPFLKMAPKTRLTALVKVTRYLSFKNIEGSPIPMSMEAEIIDTYRGTDNRKTITIWGDPGHLCRPYLSNFKEGSYYVMALIPGTPNRGQQNEKTTDYAISSCGAFWLNADLIKQTATGDIDGNERHSNTMNLAILKSALQKTAQ